VTGEDETKILLDADVIRHFIEGEKESKLHRIYPNKLLILNIVESEISCIDRFKPRLNQLINDELIEKVEFPEDYTDPDENLIIVEYATLRKSKGPGESACLVYARYKKNIVASSNLRDVEEYCKIHHIELITTLDILVEAIRLEVMSKDECNTFITKVKSKRCKLPCSTIQEYLDNLKNNVE
jgi:predicted nucleic acid-binding protein